MDVKHCVTVWYKCQRFFKNFVLIFQNAFLKLSNLKPSEHPMTFKVRDLNIQKKIQKDYGRGCRLLNRTFPFLWATNLINGCQSYVKCYHLPLLPLLFHYNLETAYTIKMLKLLYLFNVIVVNICTHFLRKEWENKW